MSDPILVTTEEAALYAGVTPRTIWRWGKQGRLTKHGGSTRGMPRWDLRELDTGMHRVSSSFTGQVRPTPDPRGSG